MDDIRVMKEVILLSPYSLSLMDVSRLTPMNKTLVDVDCETMDPKLFTKTLCLVMTCKYNLEERSTLESSQGVHDPSDVLYKTLGNHSLHKI